VPRYLRPTSQSEALDALAQGRLTVLAGGTDYYPSKVGKPLPDDILDILDISAIASLRGTGSLMHSHHNEQFNYVVKGTLKGSVNGKRVVAPAGTLIYIPANAPHTLVSTPDEDVIFLALKDLSQGIIGKAVDGTMTGPHYEPGFEPKPRRNTPARATRR